MHLDRIFSMVLFDFPWVKFNIKACIWGLFSFLRLLFYKICHLVEGNQILCISQNLSIYVILTSWLNRDYYKISTNNRAKSHFAVSRVLAFNYLIAASPRNRSTQINYRRKGKQMCGKPKRTSRLCSRARTRLLE